MQLLRGATSVLTGCEIIVLCGLIMYITEQPTIKAYRKDIMAKSSVAPRGAIKDMVADVVDFFNSEVTKVQSLLRDQFAEVLKSESIRSVSRDKWLSRELAVMVASDASKCGLDCTYSFCEEHRGQKQLIHTTLCSGIIASIPHKKSPATYEHFTGVRHAKVIPKIYHEVDYKFVSESSTETINIPNPMHCMEASIYFKDEWSVIAASIGASIRLICFFDAGAVVDNSNQTSEAYFRWMWKGEFSAWYTDAGLYVRHYH
eukprot:scaffold80525_cov88-Cyclotella_meneghiniana.AAC.1